MSAVVDNGGLTPLDPAKAARTDAEVDHQGYIARLPRAIDIFANELFGGQMDETISSRMARWATEEPAGSAKHDVGSLICHALNVVDKNHGASAEEADKERAANEVTVEEQAQEVLKDGK